MSAPSSNAASFFLIRSTVGYCNPTTSTAANAILFLPSERTTHRAYNGSWTPVAFRFHPYPAIQTTWCSSTVGVTSTSAKPTDNSAVAGPHNTNDIRCTNVTNQIGNHTPLTLVILPYSFSSRFTSSSFLFVDTHLRQASTSVPNISPVSTSRRFASGGKSTSSSCCMMIAR